MTGRKINSVAVFRDAYYVLMHTAQPLLSPRSVGKSLAHGIIYRALSEIVILGYTAEKGLIALCLPQITCSSPTENVQILLDIV